MLPGVRHLTFAGLVALGSLLVAGTRDAKAQLFVATPGFSLGLGAPVGVPAYGVYPGYGLGAYPVPVPVRPYPYAYGPRAVYGPRPYGPYYGHRPGYRRW